jgi:hypothetical protein
MYLQNNLKILLFGRSASVPPGYLRAYGIVSGKRAIRANISDAPSWRIYTFEYRLVDLDIRFLSEAIDPLLGRLLALHLFELLLDPVSNFINRDIG